MDLNSLERPVRINRQRAPEFHSKPEFGSMRAISPGPTSRYGRRRGLSGRPQSRRRLHEINPLRRGKGRSEHRSEAEIGHEIAALVLDRVRTVHPLQRFLGILITKCRGALIIGFGGAFIFWSA